MHNIIPFPIKQIRENEHRRYLEKLRYAWENIPNVMTEKEFNWYKEYTKRTDLSPEAEYWFIDNDRDIMQTDYYEQNPNDIETLKHHMLIVLGIIEDDSVLD